MEEILSIISKNPRCRLYPATGLPTVAKGHIIPDDLLSFYKICGGVDFFYDSLYSMSIVPPGELILSNIKIIGQNYEEDRSSSWYIIAKSGEEQFVSIDLGSERNGRCYDSFHEIHGVAGSSKILSYNFEDLVKRIYDSNGDYWYWLKKDFSYLGDAYD
ncbi:SMI1/KNR4 family protein [Labrys sp. KB_33_2]|uniref:SMI1/KNR4 family protein n=1 Tax=unclassified Labrys (in: a-proteobacteria) TaxID=2688601 RepID=UPI003EBA168C